jgi:polypeptide N-acetylgalactosaminyltransferase
MKSRMFGASIARSPVLVFFDAHCEVNRDWLQPLVARINEVSSV